MAARMRLKEVVGLRWEDAHVLLPRRDIDRSIVYMHVSTDPLAPRLIEVMVASLAIIFETPKIPSGPSASTMKGRTFVSLKRTNQADS